MFYCELLSEKGFKKLRAFYWPGGQVLTRYLLDSDKGFILFDIINPSGDTSLNFEFREFSAIRNQFFETDLFPTEREKSLKIEILGEFWTLVAAADPLR